MKIKMKDTSKCGASCRTSAAPATAAAAAITIVVQGVILRPPLPRESFLKISLHDLSASS